ESHCLATPGCVAGVLERFAVAGLRAASLASGHVNQTSFAGLEEALYKRNEESWWRPGTWNRVRLRGFAVRRHEYLDAGGLEARFGAFSEAALAARLHSKGV